MRAKVAVETRKPVTTVRQPSRENKPAPAPALAKASPSAPEPAEKPAAIREQAREETTRPTHHARRPTDDTSTTADADTHHSRSRPASRRAVAAYPERGPRVGDVIPPGVPLYPLPRGFRGRPPFPRVYEPHQAYLPPGQPPFPGLRGAEVDAAYPPRRVYMEPY